MNRRKKVSDLFIYIFIKDRQYDVVVAETGV